MSSTPASGCQSCVGVRGTSSVDQGSSRRNSAEFKSPLPDADAQSVEMDKQPTVTTPISGTSLGNPTLAVQNDALPCNDASLTEGQIAAISTSDEPTEGRSAFSTTELIQNYSLAESADFASDESSPNIPHTETGKIHNRQLEEKTENIKDGEIEKGTFIQSFGPENTVTNAGPKTIGNAGTENKTDDFKIGNSSKFMIPTNSIKTQERKFKVSYPEICKEKLENVQDEVINFSKPSSAPAKTILFTPGREVVYITDTFISDKTTLGSCLNHCVNVIDNHVVSDMAVINPAVQIPQRNDLRNSELEYNIDNNEEVICVNEKINEVFDQLQAALECHTFEEGKTEVKNIGLDKEYFGDATNGHGSVGHNTVLNNSISYPSKDNSEFRELYVSQITQALDGQNSTRELKFANGTNSAIRIQSSDKTKLLRQVKRENTDDITSPFPIRKNHASIETESILKADSLRILNSATNYRKHLEAMKSTKQSGILKQLQELDPCGGHGIKKIKLPIGTFKGVSLTKFPQMAGNALETGPFWEQYRRQYCLMLEMVAVNARPVDPVGFYFLKKEIHNYMQVPETRGKCRCYSQRGTFSKFTRWLRKIFCLN